MADYYYFEINSGDVTIKVVDELGPINSWEDITQPNDCITIGNGTVDDRDNPNRLILHTGLPNKEPIITLHSAGWDSKIGDTGRAELHVSGDCTPTTWTLKRIE